MLHAVDVVGKTHGEEGENIKGSFPFDSKCHFISTFLDNTHTHIHTTTTLFVPFMALAYRRGSMCVCVCVCVENGASHMPPH